MLNYLILLPVTLLLLAALGIVILRQFRPSIGYSWLIAALGGLFTTIVLIFLRWRLPMEISIIWWQPLVDLSSPPALRLDLSSWPYAFCLGVLALAFIFTDAARLETEARPLNWALGLVLCALGQMAVMAGNPIALIVTWTAIDLVEFVMVMSTEAGRRMGVQTVTLFSVRVGGTLLVILAILFARSQAIPFDLSPIPTRLALFMLLAAGLRLGVLPLNIPYTQEIYATRGLGNVMRMLGPASALAVLGRMPVQVVPEPYKNLFLFLSALAALYGAAMWLASDNEINGRPFWMTTLAALSVASVVDGMPQASIAWGMVLILAGSLIFFYSARRREILFIPLLGMLGIAGLPFTPAAAGWMGLAGKTPGFFTGLFILAVMLLLWGYLRHTLRPREELYRMERWVHTIYPMGLMNLVLAQWFIAVLGWPGSLSLGVWWASIPVALVTLVGVVLAFTFRSRWLAGRGSGEQVEAGEAGGLVAESSRASRRWIEIFARQVGGGLSAFFRLNWLYAFIAWIYQLVQGVVQLITAMFEGDGGILWSLVMLALLLSLLIPGVRP